MIRNSYSPISYFKLWLLSHVWGTMIDRQVSLLLSNNIIRSGHQNSRCGFFNLSSPTPSQNSVTAQKGRNIHKTKHCCLIAKHVKKKPQTQTQWKQGEKERDGFGSNGRSSPTHNSIQLNSQRHSHSCLCQQQAQVFSFCRHPLVQVLLPRTRSQWTHWSSWKPYPFFQG